MSKTYTRQPRIAATRTCPENRLDRRQRGKTVPSLCGPGFPGVVESMNATPLPQDPLSLHPAYFETHFAVDGPLTDWPADFAIVTAWATTGENWTDAQNRAADQALELELRQTGCWLRRITGYSPTTGHAEPGWAVALPMDQACDVGLKFRQDAIYIVRSDDLLVTHCDDRRKLVPVGPFRERIKRPAPGGSGS